MSDRPPLDAGESEMPDTAAAELALGLLEGEERAVAIRRVLAEPGFARAVELWRARLAQLFDLWPEMTAPDILARIERSIDRFHGDVVALPARAASRIWPALAGLSSVAAAALLVVLVNRPAPLPPVASRAPAPVVVVVSPTLVASVAPSAKGTPVTAIYEAHGGTIRLTEANLAEGDRTAQLWVIPTGGVPHSLGLLSPHGRTELTLDAESRARIAAGATLAVSIEPVGGSPTGLPTGPVVATGALTSI